MVLRRCAYVCFGTERFAGPDPKDAAGVTAVCSLPVIDIGMLNGQAIPVMFAAGKRSGRHPVVSDPDGAGALEPRTKTAPGILNEV